MVLPDSIINFLHYNFILPLIDETVHYNIYNTTVYALLLAFFVVYLGIPYIKKLGLELDRRFYISLIPFIVLGGATRSLEDAGIVDSVFFVTPFIYVLMFVFTSTVLWLSLKAEKRFDIDYHLLGGSVGSILLVYVLILLSPENFQPLLVFLATVTAWTVPGYIVLKYLKPDYLNYLFIAPVAAHLLDASTTFTGITFNAEEKHVLADFFIQSFGPAGIFILKIGVIIPAVYYIYENMEGDEKVYYLFIITLLGLGIATRNLVSLVSL